MKTFMSRRCDGPGCREVYTPTGPRSRWCPRCAPGMKNANRWTWRQTAREKARRVARIMRGSIPIVDPAWPRVMAEIARELRA